MLNYFRGAKPFSDRKLKEFQLAQSRRKALFRKVALSLWSHHGNPSVYGFTEIDVTPMPNKSLVLTYVVKALGETMHNNSELTSMVRWGQIVNRTDKTISVMVNIPGPKVNDLSAMNLQDVHSMTTDEIQKKLESKAEGVRQLRDPHLGPMLNIISYVPQPVLKTFLKIYEFLIYELDTRLGLHFIPIRPFGSIIVSNVGSLGIKTALLPLVPLARAPLMVSVGQITSEARVVDGAICIRQIAQLGVTFDHRIFDGSHAGRMLKEFHTVFSNLLKV